MLFPEFVEILSTLSELDAEYIVVGGYAIGVHLDPRATKDLDLLVRPTKANAKRVYAALQRFGAPLFELSVDDLATPGMVFQIGVPPRRVDILTAITAVSFAEAWRSRVEIELAGLRKPVVFLGREALRKNKQAVGRPQDVADVARLDALTPPRGRPPARRRKAKRR